MLVDKNYSQSLEILFYQNELKVLCNNNLIITLVKTGNAHTTPSPLNYQFIAETNSKLSLHKKLSIGTKL